MGFKRSNCIVVFDKNMEKMLFCKRAKEPYKGLLNFVGGKIEDGETSIRAAYRELYEETGIGKNDIKLCRLMDMTYYQQQFVLEIYAGVLQNNVKLIEEVNSLEWITVKDNFADSDRYAGDKNIAHIVEMAKKFEYGNLDNMSEFITNKGFFVGVDACKGGWIAALIRHGALYLYKYTNFAELVSDNACFDVMIVDMVIGLPGNTEQYGSRPDVQARNIVKPRTSTIFAVPTRQAVYEDTREKQKEANIKTIGKGLTEQTIAIMPKMREVDEFLLSNNEYINVIKESHPEVCFARLKGEVLMTKKSKKEGVEERISVLSEYLPEVTDEYIKEAARTLKCNADDILDAVCLVVTANLHAQGKAEPIPVEPVMDDKGILMQMIIPKK